MTAGCDPDPSVVERAQTPATHHSRARFPLSELLSEWTRRSADVAPFQRVRGAPQEPLIGSPSRWGKGRGEAPELSAVLEPGA